MSGYLEVVWNGTLDREWHRQDTHEPPPPYRGRVYEVSESIRTLALHLLTHASPEAPVTRKQLAAHLHRSNYTLNMVIFDLRQRGCLQCRVLGKGRRLGYWVTV